MNVKVCIWFDAACKGTPVPDGDNIGIGVYTTINGVHNPDYSGKKNIGINTVPMGEWIGLWYALSVARIIKSEFSEHKLIPEFYIFGDAQVIVRCFNGEYKISKRFRHIYNLSHNVRCKLGKYLQGVAWVPREHNTEADKLSKEALTT
jgi:ribonuclease HI